MKVTVILIVIDALGTIPKWLVKRLGDIRTRKDYPEYKITKIGQNTKKSHGNLRNFLSFKLQNLSANASVKKSQMSNNNNNTQPNNKYTYDWVRKMTHWELCKK